MVGCRTELDKHAMNALSRYHIASRIEYKRRKKLLYFLGAVLLLIGVCTTYTTVKSYSGTDSLLLKLVMPAVLLILGVAVIITAEKGMVYGLTRELKSYFDKTQIRYLDYVISENGIRISVKGNASIYKWDMIDKFVEDEDYYYFSSKDKYNLIAKKGLSEKNREVLTNLAKNANKFGK